MRAPSRREFSLRVVLNLGRIILSVFSRASMLTLLPAREWVTTLRRGVSIKVCRSSRWAAVGLGRATVRVPVALRWAPLSISLPLVLLQIKGTRIRGVRWPCRCRMVALSPLTISMSQFWSSSIPINILFIWLQFVITIRL